MYFSLERAFVGKASSHKVLITLIRGILKIPQKIRPFVCKNPSQAEYD